MGTSFRTFLATSSARRRCFLFASALLICSTFLLFLDTAAAFATTNVGGTIAQNTEWTTAGSPYVVYGTVTVAQGATLGIDSGVVVKFSGTGANITVNGTLNANSAVFTSIKDDAYGGDTNGDGNLTQPQAGDWKYIWFGSAGSGSLSGCTVLWGGYYTGTSGMVSVATTTASVSITNSTISHSVSFGIYAFSGANPAITGSTISNNANDGLKSESALSTLSGNTFTSNAHAALKIPAVIGAGVTNNTYSGNSINGMVFTGDVTQSTSWDASNSPYVIEGNVNQTYMKVSQGTVLTVGAGAVVKPESGRGLEVIGSLNADGAVFTSIKDDSYGGDTNGDGGTTQAVSGDWERIEFDGASSSYGGGSGTLTSDVIKYGGHLVYGYYDDGEILIEDNFYSNGQLISADPVTISGCAISNSQGSGIYLWSGQLSVNYTDIFANVTGIKNQGAIAANTSQSSGQNLDATHNYWGSKHGPKPTGRGNGTSGPVNVLPWSRLPFTAEGAAYQATLGMDDYCAKCGDPINMSTGAFVYSHTDISIPAKGTPLDFIRTYNSNDATDGPLGYGWSLNWQTSPNPQANGNVTMLMADGRWDTFIKQAAGTFLPPAGHLNTLNQNTDGTYKLQTPQMEVYNFDANNSLASVVNEKNETTTFTYDANQHLTAVHDPAGRTLSIAYDADNHINHISDPAGNTVSFGYSAAGDLTSVTDQDGGVTTYSYDNYHHITGITDPNGHTSANNAYDGQGRVTSQTDAGGNPLSFAYDTTDRKTTMTRQMDPNDPDKDEVSSFYYDDNYRTIRETDPEGKDTTFTFDSAGNRQMATDRRGVVAKKLFDSAGNVTDSFKAFGLAEEQHSSATYNTKNHPLTITDARGQTTSYTYDPTGTYLLQVNYPAVTSYDNTVSNYTESFTYNPDGSVATHTDKNGNTTSYTYNQYGLPASETRNINRDPADQVTINYIYNDLSQKISETDGKGNTTDYQYDQVGNLRYVTKHVTDPSTNNLVDVTTEYQYDASGNKVKVIDAEGKATSYDYTPTSRLSKITDTNLNTIEYTYDAAGNRTGEKDRNGNWSHFGFDLDNRMVSVTDPEGNTTGYGYDEEGNLTSVTDPLYQTKTKTYDGLGRVTSSTDPDENNTTRTTSYSYDAGDNLLTITDPDGHTTTSAYDEIGRLRQVSDPLGDSTYYAYDGLGNRVKMKDGLGHETSYGYSPNNWLVSVTDAAGGVTSYERDRKGNMTRQTDAEGRVTLYSYDELNRLTEQEVDAGAGDYLLNRVYTYDKTGHVLTDNNGEGIISNTYDDVYNLSGMTDRQGDWYNYSYDANGNRLTLDEGINGYSLSYQYNTRNQLTAAHDYIGTSEARSYDAAGNLVQNQDTTSTAATFTTDIAYTPRNQVQTVSQGASTSTFGYDPAGNLITKGYPNGMTTTYAYDAANRKTGSQSLDSSQQLLQSFAQTYDANSNVTSRTENGSLTTNYVYDSLDRLTSEQIGGYGNVDYGYDISGNRLTLDSPATGHTDYSYNAANQLTQSVNGDTTTNYAYLSGGELSQVSDGTNTATYAYDGMGRLVSFMNGAQWTAFVNDPMGRRMVRVYVDNGDQWRIDADYEFNSDVANYLIDGFTGQLKSSSLSGPDGLISTTAYTSGAPATSYYLYNPHGDTTGLANENAALTNTLSYDAFGNQLSGDPITYGYAGKYQRYTEPVLGTIQMGVRDYDPKTGRFTEADPLSGAATEPLTQNRYNYVSSNPLNRYDLYGKQEEPLIEEGQELLEKVAELLGEGEAEEAIEVGGDDMIEQLNSAEHLQQDLSDAESNGFTELESSSEACDANTPSYAPRLAEALDDPSKLGELAGKISVKDLIDLAKDSSALRFYDMRTGYLNIINQFGGRLIRITMDIQPPPRIFSTSLISLQEIVNRVIRGDYFELG